MPDRDPPRPRRTFATDYDGTLAKSGRVRDQTIAGLRQLKSIGWRLLLITGRELRELKMVFPGLGEFDLAVVENGACLYDPRSDSVTPLGPAPPEALVDRLRAEGVARMSVGRGIIALWEPQLAAASRAIEGLAAPWRIVRNKRAVMLLPVGVDKATGFAEALRHLGVEPAGAVGIGDAENDLAFLRACGFSAAVANALPEVASAVDYHCEGERGAGVEELIELCLADRLPPRSPQR